MSAEPLQGAELASVATELYGRPLREFIEHRTAAARELDKPLAASVRALRKPSPAAWLVDQLVRSDAAEIAAAIALGVDLQRAQTDGDGERIRDLSRRHRDEVRNLTESARTIAVSSGLTASAAVLDGVAQTVSAGMSDAGAAAAIRSGLLVRSLRSTGFEPVDLTDAIAVPGVALPDAAGSDSMAAPATPASTTAAAGRPSRSAEKRAAEKRDRPAEERRRRELGRQRTALEKQRDQAGAEAARLARELDALDNERQEKAVALSDAHARIADLDKRLHSL